MGTIGVRGMLSLSVRGKHYQEFKIIVFIFYVIGGLLCVGCCKAFVGVLVCHFLFFYYGVVDLIVLSLLLNNILSSLKNKNACTFLCIPKWHIFFQ